MSNILSGARVLDFTTFVSGQYSTMVLADAGAEVIKIERPDTGEVFRTYGPIYLRGESSSFLSVNRNKKSLAVNLKSAEGKALVQKLVKNADILVENMKPGTMEKLGFGYEELSKINPRLIYASISGFGATGPYRERGGFDLIAQSMSSLMSVCGEADGNPVKVGYPVSDFLGGIYAAMAILLAYISRQKTNCGQFVETSLTEAAMSLSLMAVTNYYIDGKLPQRMGTASLQNAPYEGFATKNGFITIGTGNDVLWARLCEKFGLQELLDNPDYKDNASRVKNQKALAALVQGKIRLYDTEQALGMLNEIGVPAGPIYNLAEAMEDPQTIARKNVIDVPHPTGGTYKTLSLPIKMSDEEFTYNAPPSLGANNEELLLEAGYSRVEIDHLRAGGVISP